MSKASNTPNRPLEFAVLDDEDDGVEARALDQIEDLLGDIVLTDLPPLVQQRICWAWACAREHSPDPKLIPKAVA